MKELDLLKKDWQKIDNSFEQVSEIDIYKMIHKYKTVDVSETAIQKLETID